jgi:hypothetical protein
MHFAPASEVLNLTEAHRNVDEKAVATVQERSAELKEHLKNIQIIIKPKNERG